MIELIEFVGGPWDGDFNRPHPVAGDQFCELDPEIRWGAGRYRLGNRSTDPEEPVELVYFWELA